MVLEPARGDLVVPSLPEGDLGLGLGPEERLVAEDALARVEVDGEFPIGNPVGDPPFESRADPFLGSQVFPVLRSRRSVSANFPVRLL